MGEFAGEIPHAGLERQCHAFGEVSSREGKGASEKDRKSEENNEDRTKGEVLTQRQWWVGSRS